MNYWSCSKFADWIRGTNKPISATSEGWRDWKNEAKLKHPIRYWIADEALDNIQDFINWPIDQLYEIKYWFNNRFVTKSHTLTSNLKKGSWYELDTRLLHCMFDELVNFIEIEIAMHHVVCDKTARKKYQSPFYAYGWFRWRTWRCPEAGIDHLKWASSLKHDKDSYIKPSDPLYGKPTLQAISAKEILVLYDWWKNKRPARPDPHDASGWSAYCDEKREKEGDGIEFFDGERTPADRKRVRKMLDLCNKIENKQTEEDTEMMTRLIKIRQSLWT
jgi:hypothetical protein